MLAKLIGWGDTRESARRRVIAALRSYPILGIRTNIGLLLELLEHPRFIAGELDTGFLDAEGDAIRARLTYDATPAVLAITAAARSVRLHPDHAQRSSAGLDPWISLRGARV
jgi:acetyl/propionyl-CoA carboxylase alpha subunit